MTYTKKTALEGQERLVRRGLLGAGRVQCGTVHSFCFKLLQRHHAEAGYARSPQVLEDAEGLEVLQQCHRWVLGSGSHGGGRLAQAAAAAGLPVGVCLQVSRCGALGPSCRPA